MGLLWFQAASLFYVEKKGVTSTHFKVINYWITWTRAFFPLSHTVSYGPIVPIFCKGLHLKPFYGREGEKREEKVEKSEALHTKCLQLAFSQFRWNFFKRPGEEPEISKQMFGPFMYLHSDFSPKKTSFSPIKNTFQIFFWLLFTFISMQLLSADPIIFSKKFELISCP